jgi:DNA-binding CsgD family transcriptional regulator
MRVAELRATVRALSGSESSGVIITGAAGSGRTTLLGAAAEKLSGPFAVSGHSIPESCRRIRFGIGGILAPELPATLNVSPLTIVRACRDALRSHESGTTGILLVLDNIDHLDGMSLWVLNQLLSEPGIKMLASHRSDRQLQLELMESVVARQLAMVALEDLTLEQTLSFLQHRLPAGPTPSLVREVHALSGANPLTAHWLIDEALAGGDIVEQEGICEQVRPLGIKGAQQFDLARRRLDALTSEQRQVVDFLAVAEPAPLSVLAHAVPAEALSDLQQRNMIQIRIDGKADVTLSHEVEGTVARQQLQAGRSRELQGKFYGISGRPREDSLWGLLRRVESSQENGTAVPDLDLLAVATTANNLYDSDRALRAAEAIKAPELQLMARTEVARALFHSRKYVKSVGLLRSLVDTTPAVLSIEFARAVSLLLQALLPTNPGRDALQAVLDRARRRLSLAAAASRGETAADNYQNAVHDELDVLQLYLESREGNWPSPGGELFHRLCPAESFNAEPGGPEDSPPSQAGILLLALASQGLSAGGKSADAVALSARALSAVERLPRCSVDFHSTVLTIHASNLTRLGQSPVSGTASAERTGNNKWMTYPGGPLQLFRAMMFCRHTAADGLTDDLRQAGVGTSGDPDDLLTLTLGAQATAAWLMWDLDQVRGSATAPDGHLGAGGLASQLAESYASVASSAVTGFAATGATGSHRRPVREPSGAAGARGRRALELLSLGVVARPENPGYEHTGEEIPEWGWGSDGSQPQDSAEPLDGFPTGPGRHPGRQPAEPRPGGSGNARLTAAEASKLSHREREVAVLVVSGLGSADVAAQLGIAVNTVNAHLQRIYGKLGVCRRQELADLWKGLSKAEQ